MPPPSLQTDRSSADSSSLVTKLGKFASKYPRKLELNRGGVVTRKPETGEITNEWSFADITAVKTDGVLFTLSLAAAKGPLGCIHSLCGLPATLNCEFSTSAAAEKMAGAVNQALMHGYDGSTRARSQIEEEESVIVGRQIGERQPTSDLVAAAKQQQQAKKQHGAAAQVKTAVGYPVTADSAATRAKLDAEEEQAAAAELQSVADGIGCLAGGEHEWRRYDGQRGSGRGCDKCFMCQDAVGRVTWRISPALSPEASSSAVKLLTAWRDELRRVSYEDGCIAGGEHAWLDASMTMLRLSAPGKCCRQCGLVCDASGRRLVLPNMLGQFGPAVAPSNGGHM